MSLVTRQPTQEEIKAQEEARRQQIRSTTQANKDAAYERISSREQGIADANYHIRMMTNPTSATPDWSARRYGRTAEQVKQDDLKRQRDQAAINADRNAAKSQPNKESERQKWPGEDLDLENIYFGVPPVFPHISFQNRNSSSSIDDLFESVSSYEKAIFLNSFPILSITPLNVKRPTNVQSMTQVTSEEITYKFFIKNEGGVTYDISNEYGSSMVEDFFQSGMNSETMGNIIQFAKTSSIFKNMALGFDGMMESKFKEAWTTIQKDLDGMMGNFTKAMNETGFGGGTNATTGEAAKNVGNIGAGMKSLAATALKGLIMGNKIDIPDIWKGSSSSNTQNVSIILHCQYPEDDVIYENTVITPLKILFRLALPYSTTSSARINNESGANSGDVKDSNDIITYENPPYIKAKIDGMFETKLGAISSMSVSSDFMNQSYVRAGRPMIIKVDLTIRDLYNVIIWEDGNDKSGSGSPRDYGPTGNQIADNMKYTMRDDFSGRLKDNGVMDIVYSQFLAGDWDKVKGGQVAASPQISATDLSKIAEEGRRKREQKFQQKIQADIRANPNSPTLYTMYDEYGNEVSRHIYTGISPENIPWAGEDPSKLTPIQRDIQKRNDEEWKKHFESLKPENIRRQVTSDQKMKPTPFNPELNKYLKEHVNGKGIDGITDENQRRELINISNLLNNGYLELKDVIKGMKKSGVQKDVSVYT